MADFSPLSTNHNPPHDVIHPTWPTFSLSPPITIHASKRGYPYQTNWLYYYHVSSFCEIKKEFNFSRKAVCRLFCFSNNIALVAREAALIGRKFCLSSRIFFSLSALFLPCKITTDLQDKLECERKTKQNNPKTKKKQGKAVTLFTVFRVCRGRNPRCLKYLFTARKLSRWPCWPNIKARPAPGNQNKKQTSTGLAFNRSLEKKNMSCKN